MEGVDLWNLGQISRVAVRALLARAWHVALNLADREVKVLVAVIVVGSVSLQDAVKTEKTTPHRNALMPLPTCAQ